MWHVAKFGAWKSGLSMAGRGGAGQGRAIPMPRDKLLFSGGLFSYLRKLSNKQVSEQHHFYSDNALSQRQVTN